jgi:hypothetical protein
MDDLHRMNQFITGAGFGGVPCTKIRDEQDNNLIRIAVKKLDLPIVQWHILKQGTHDITAEDVDYCVALCVEQLNPKKTETCAGDKKNAYNILKTLAQKHEDGAFTFALRAKPCRENFIKQLILLQIKHTKHPSDFVFEQDLITQHVTSHADDESPILLTDMYQTVANKKGNTLSHFLVHLHNADELYQLMNKNYISALPNKANKTVVDLALEHFQQFTQDPTQFDLYPEKAAQTYCCLFMLLRYIKSKNKGYVTSQYKCCDKHMITI